jgi:hypothetical protein
MTLQLNVDGTVIAAPYGIVLANEPVLFQFDSTGNLQSGAQIYSNAELQPQNSNGLGTYYLVTFYDANGARINKNPMWWQFTEPANSTVNISAMTPYMVAGGNIIYYPIPVGGDGTVTSVAFVGDGTIFSTTPSTPVTSAGDIGPTLLTQSANTFLAGPTSGAAADPTFRAITASDISGLVPGSSNDIIYNESGALAANSAFTFTPSTFAFQVSNGAVGTAYIGALDSVLGNVSFPPVNLGISASTVINRIAVANQLTATGSPYIGLGVINQDNFANDSTGGITGLLVDAISNNSTTVGYNSTIFPSGINGAYILATHIGSGNLTGTNFGVVALTCRAAVFTNTTVSSVCSIVADTGHVAGTTVGKATAIWIPGYTDAGGSIGVAQAIYVGPYTATDITTAWGLYIDGVATPNFFGGNSTLQAVQISNLTAATSGANQSSPLELISGQYWTGTVTATDGWTFQDVLGTGANPTSKLALVHSGSTGVIALQLPAAASIEFGTDTGLSRASAGIVDVGNGTPGDASGTMNAAQYNVAGVQIAASNLSNGTTGTGAIVLAASPALTGAPAIAAATATTPATSDNSTNVATTAYVQAQGYVPNGSFVIAGIVVPNPKLIGSSFAVTAGNNDVYTVPANRRAIWYGTWIANNTGTTGSWYACLKISGTYYQIQPSQSLTGGGATPGSVNTGTTDAFAMILEAGQSLSWVVATSGAGYIWTSILEFDNTSPVSQIFIPALVTGNNTIATAPTGKHITILNTAQVVVNQGTIAAQSLFIYNKSGSSITGNTLTITPNGGSNIVIAATFTSSSSSVGATTVATTITAPGPFTLNAGDSLILSAGTVAGSAYLWGYQLTY